MNRLPINIVGTLVALCFASAAQAQFWKPAPVIVQQPAPVIVQKPAPVIVQQPAPVVVSHSFPTVASPVVTTTGPVTRVYRAPIVTYQPVRYTYTRRRPILGGTVTRTRYGYRRVVF